MGHNGSSPDGQPGRAVTGYGTCLMACPLRVEYAYGSLVQLRVAWLGCEGILQIGRFTCFFLLKKKSIGESAFFKNILVPALQLRRRTDSLLPLVSCRDGWEVVCEPDNTSSSKSGRQHGRFQKEQNHVCDLTVSVCPGSRK